MGGNCSCGPSQKTAGQPPIHTSKTRPIGTLIRTVESVWEVCESGGGGSRFTVTLGRSIFRQRIYSSQRRSPTNDSSRWLGLWSSLAGRKRKFPVRFLADSKQTLLEFVEPTPRS